MPHSSSNPPLPAGQPNSALIHGAQVDAKQEKSPDLKTYNITLVSATSRQALFKITFQSQTLYNKSFNDCIKAYAEAINRQLGTSLKPTAEYFDSQKVRPAGGSAKVEIFAYTHASEQIPIKENDLSGNSVALTAKAVTEIAAKLNTPSSLPLEEWRPLLVSSYIDSLKEKDFDPILKVLDEYEKNYYRKKDLLVKTNQDFANESHYVDISANGKSLIAAVERYFAKAHPQLQDQKAPDVKTQPVTITAQTENVIEKILLASKVSDAVKKKFFKKMQELLHAKQTHYELEPNLHVIIKVNADFLEDADLSYEAITRRNKGNIKPPWNFVGYETFSTKKVFSTNQDDVNSSAKSLHEGEDGVEIILGLSLNPIEAKEILESKSIETRKNIAAKLTENDVVRCIPIKLAYLTILKATSVTQLGNALLKQISLEDLPSRAPADMVKIINELNDFLNNPNNISKNDNPDEKLKIIITAISNKINLLKAEIYKYLEQNPVYENRLNALRKYIDLLEGIEKSIQNRLEYLKAKDKNFDISFFKIVPFVEPKIQILQKPPIAMPKNEEFFTHRASGATDDGVEKEIVDLKIFPSVLDLKWDKTDRMTIGDLHGNFIKLIYILYHENIITGINQDDYEKLLTIYDKRANDVTSDDKKQFEDIITKIISVHGENSPLIRLIGDCFSDRGPSNDYFTLRLFHHLKAIKIPFQNIISNHDRDFIKAHEQHDIEQKQTESQTALSNFRFRTDISIPQAISLHNLGVLITKGIVDEKQVTAMIESSYLPSIKAMHLSVNNESNPIEINYTTHAEAPLERITEVGEQFKLPMTNDPLKTIPALQSAVKCVNDKNSELIANGKFHESSRRGTPLYKLMWERAEEVIDKRITENLPQGCKVNYIHGHSGHGKIANLGSYLRRDVNLDNVLGQSRNNEEFYSWFYTGNNKNFLALRNQARLAAKAKAKSPVGNVFAVTGTANPALFKTPSAQELVQHSQQVTASQASTASASAQDVKSHGKK